MLSGFPSIVIPCLTSAPLHTNTLRLCHHSCSPPNNTNPCLQGIWLTHYADILRCCTLHRCINLKNSIIITSSSSAILRLLLPYHKALLFIHPCIWKTHPSCETAAQWVQQTKLLPQPSPSRARTLEAGKRWARLAQAAQIHTHGPGHPEPLLSGVKVQQVWCPGSSDPAEACPLPACPPFPAIALRVSVGSGILPRPPRGEAMSGPPCTR